MAESSKPDNFAEHAELPQLGIVREFWDFLRFNKKWWLTPVVIVLLLIGSLIMVGGSAVAPFVYPFF